MNRFGPILASLVAGCSGSGTLTVPGTVDPSSTSPSPSSPATETSSPGTPPETGTPPTEEILDCDALPAAPLSMIRIDGVLPSEEFTFDGTGYAYNLPDGRDAVFRTRYGESTELFAPFSSVEVAGVRVLTDGSLAVANEQAGAVERVDLTSGARTVIAAGINQPNSLEVGPDGRLYIAAFSEILRVDPSAPDEVERLFLRAGTDLDGLTFTPDRSGLYFNYDERGEIRMLALDPDGDVTDTLTFAEIPLGFGPNELDGMTTDACGNVYVVRTDGELWRVDPQGNAERYAEAPSGAWTTAVRFGSGVGGWQRDRLYLMDRTEGLVEIEVGLGAP